MTSIKQHALMCNFLLLLLLVPLTAASATSITQYTRNSQQGIHDFLVAAAPPQSTLKNYSFSLMKIQGQEMLVGIYEREAGFDDSGNPWPISSDPGNRQFAFAFIKNKNAPTQYTRVPITGFFDDGGSPTNVLAIFSAVFKQKSASKLAFLTQWDSSSAGGHRAMDKVGTWYNVVAFSFESPTTFKEFKSPAIEKLGGCDCETQNLDTEEGDQAEGFKPEKEYAKARDVKGVKKQLITMGIPQT